MPVEVLIVGAGIVGLSTAVALARQGHHTRMFERSRVNNETGPALQFTPEVMGILQKDWELDMTQFKPTIMKFWRVCMDLSVGAEGPIVWGERKPLNPAEVNCRKRADFFSPIKKEHED